jgi:cobaltochelatase CobS
VTICGTVGGSKALVLKTSTKKKGKHKMETQQTGSSSLFSLLTKAMSKDPRIAQRVTAHVRAVSNHNTVIAYHNNGSSEEDKKKLYADCLVAIRNGDYSKLQGQVAAGQATPPQEERQEEKPAPAPRSRKPAFRAPEPIKTVAEQVDEITAQINQQESSPEKIQAIDSNNPAELIARALQMLQPKHEAPKVEIDEARILTLVAEKSAAIETNVKEYAGRMVDNYLKAIPPRAVVEIRPIEGEKFEIPRQHYKFPLLMACLSQRIPVCLVGPAGSSKSTACKYAADALKLPFGTVNFGPTTSKADLFGYKDANGNYHSTELVRTALAGGVFCGDEFDAGHAGIATMINMPLANRILPTPEGTKEVHADWIPVFAGNTFGTGANRMYVGRNQMDAATLDRMVFIEWDYDVGLEAAILGEVKDSPEFDIAEGGSEKPGQWLERVEKVRAAVAKLGIRHLVTPRASIYGSKLLLAGVGLKHVQDIVLWKGLDSESVNKIKSSL